MLVLLVTDIEEPQSYLHAQLALISTPPQCHPKPTHWVERARKPQMILLAKVLETAMVESEFKKLTIKTKVESFVITIILTHLAHFNGLLQPIPVQMVSII